MQCLAPTESGPIKDIQRTIDRVIGAQSSMMRVWTKKLSVWTNDTEELLKHNMLLILAMIESYQIVNNPINKMSQYMKNMQITKKTNKQKKHAGPKILKKEYSFIKV